MASRKTYFGIGLPKDLIDPGKGPGGRDPEDDSGQTSEGDRSAPTVIDDEKVAEGLRQLRSWYQGDAKEDKSSSDAARVAPPASPLGALNTRPTAVGHATAPPPTAPSRPMAPDPMRATMYGHDIHRFEFESAASAVEATPVTSTDLVPIPDPETRITDPSVPGGVPSQAARSQSDAFQLANIGNGEAQRLQRPPGIRRSSPDHRPARAGRHSLTSRIMLAGGLASLTIALLVSLGSHSESEADGPAAQPAPVPTRMSTPVPAPLPAARSAPAPAGPGQLVTTPVRARASTPLPAVRSAPTAPAAPTAAGTPSAASSMSTMSTKTRFQARSKAIESEKRLDGETSSDQKAPAEAEKSAAVSDTVPPPVERPAPPRRRADSAKATDSPARRKVDPVAGDEDATLPPSDE